MAKLLWLLEVAILTTYLDVVVGECTAKVCKIVMDAGGLSGTYTPVGSNSECSDGCEYKRVEDGGRYCLQQPGLYDTKDDKDCKTLDIGPELPRLEEGNYTFKGEKTLLEDLPVYFNKNGSKCIIWNYDIFGAGPGTRSFQLVDYFANQGFTVLMPDYFRGKSLIPGLPGFAEAFALESNLTNVLRDWERVKKFGESIPCKTYGSIGTCWGTYPVMHFSTIPDFKAGVSMHPSHPQIMPMLGQNETEILTKVQCPQLLMPSKDDAPSVKLGGLAENTLKDVKIIEFNEMDHGWTVRGNLSVPAIDRDVHKALESAIKFFQYYLKI